MKQHNNKQNRRRNNRNKRFNNPINNNSLYEQLCQPNYLFRAWEKVRRKNKTGGIDQQTVADFEQSLPDNIHTLAAQLSANTYVPEPYKRVHIRKNETEYRALGLLTVKDKVVQQAIRNLIDPIFDPLFLNVSYAYRAGKGTNKAISRIRHFINHEKRFWIVQCDIDDYFDSVSHTILQAFIEQHIPDKTLVQLIMLSLKAGCVTNTYKWQDIEKGLPQGGLIAPLLSNLYLQPLDELMVQKKYGFVRYADDFVALTHHKNQAEKALEDIKAMLQNTLQLQLNPNYKICNNRDGFEYLGLYFKGHRVDISEKKKQQLYDSISTHIGFNTNQQLSEKAIETIRGIGNYYGKLLPQNMLGLLDKHLLEVLTYKAQVAINRKVIPSKKQLRSALHNFRFFSQAYQLAAPQHIKELLNKIHRKKANQQTVSSEQKLDKGVSKKTKSTAKTTKKKSLDKLVKDKKRHYQKLEQKGMELVVSQPGIYIGKAHYDIVLKQRGTVIKKVKTAGLKNITIAQKGIVISSDAIRLCMNKNISIDFIDYNGRPYAMLYQPYANNAKLGLAQLKAFDSGKAATLAQDFVMSKLKNQANLMKYFGKSRSAASLKEGHTDYKQLAQNIEDILANELYQLDTSDYEQFRNYLFSIEARAAKQYWQGVRQLLDGHADFAGRTRRGATDLVNCMLNYGYGIMYSRIWEAVIKSRLNPHISYLHAFQNNKPTLVYDLIEQFRPQAVDRPVISLLTKGPELFVNEAGRLDDATKKHLLNAILNRLNKPEKYRGKQVRFSDIVQQQVYHLSHFLQDKKKTYKPYIAKW